MILLDLFREGRIRCLIVVRNEDRRFMLFVITLVVGLKWHSVTRILAFAIPSRADIVLPNSISSLSSHDPKDAFSVFTDSGRYLIGQEESSQTDPDCGDLSVFNFAREKVVV